MYSLKCTSYALNYSKCEMLTPAFAEMLDFARKPLNSICTDFIPILKDSQNEK